MKKNKVVSLPASVMLSKALSELVSEGKITKRGGVYKKAK